MNLQTTMSEDTATVPNTHLKLSFGRRVLIVEDDPGATKVFYNIIRSLDNGIEVDSVYSAEAARKRLKTETYDLIVADNFLLGDETGLDLWLYCCVFFPKLPFLVTSGNKIQSVISDLREGGSSPNFLLKPFRFNQCREMIRVLLESRPTRQTVPSDDEDRNTFKAILERII